MFCKNCGSECNDGAKFCNVCGAQIATQPQMAEQTPPAMGMPQMESIGVAPTPNPMQGMAMSPKDTVNSWIARTPGKEAGIAGMVLGIVALPFTCLTVFHWLLMLLGAVIAVVGVILSGVGYYKAKQTGAKAGMALAGLICSSVAILTYFILIVVSAYFAFAASVTYSRFF